MPFYRFELDECLAEPRDRYIDARRVWNKPHRLRRSSAELLNLIQKLTLNILRLLFFSFLAEVVHSCLNMLYMYFLVAGNVAFSKVISISFI